jgi:Domain of unknown function (DUF4276)
VVKIYVEGGAPGKLGGACRKAFVNFLLRAGVSKDKFTIVASGSRSDAFRNFRIAVTSGTNAVLLVDSECEVAGAHEVSDDPSMWNPWDHLLSNDGHGWTHPKDSLSSQCHLMVQTMESWLVCDKEALTEFFGHLFNKNLLPNRLDIEAESKNDVYDKLTAASSSALPKGKYHKGRHSFDLLGLIDPKKVESRSKWAKRFLTHMRNLAN